MQELPSDPDQSVAGSLNSVTWMYERAKDGDSQAAGALWEAFSKRLFGLARAVLRQRGISPAQASEDSVVNEAFAKFFQAIANGKYQEVADRHELWCLLAVIARNSALNKAKRAGKHVAIDSDPESVFRDHADDAPTPQEIIALSDTIEALEEQIRGRSVDPSQAERVIRVMTMSLSGNTQKEIAAAIGQSEVTVRRNLKMIRDLLDRQIND